MLSAIFTPLSIPVIHGSGTEALGSIWVNGLVRKEILEALVRLVLLAHLVPLEVQRRSQQAVLQHLVQDKRQPLQTSAQAAQQSLTSGFPLALLAPRAQLAALVLLGRLVLRAHLAQRDLTHTILPVALLQCLQSVRP
jgi:hypothetical protein